jgi:hypothetical protein
MASSGMLRPVAIVRIDVSEELSAEGDAKRRNIPEDAILHSHRRENLRSYIITITFTFGVPLLLLLLLLMMLL